MGSQKLQKILGIITEQLDSRQIPFALIGALPVMGRVSVVQPVDYIVLKLMAMANQPEKGAGDESDIRSVLECYRLNQIPTWCNPLDRERIESFSIKFGQEKVIKRLFQEMSNTAVPGEGIVI